MPETDNKTTADKASPKPGGAVSLPGAALPNALPGGFGGAARYVPTEAEKDEQERIRVELEKERQ